MAKIDLNILGNFFCFFTTIQMSGGPKNSGFGGKQDNPQK